MKEDKEKNSDQSSINYVQTIRSTELSNDQGDKKQNLLGKREQSG